MTFHAEVEGQVNQTLSEDSYTGLNLINRGRALMA